MGKIPNYSTSEGDQTSLSLLLCALASLPEVVEKFTTDGPVGDNSSNSDPIKSLGKEKHNIFLVHLYSRPSMI